jgi:Flp pilus assembly protein CpaB
MARDGSVATDLDDGPDPGGPGRTASGRRRIGGRRPLPSGRAVVGGLLVALAMVVAFQLGTGGGDRPGRSVVVARRAIRLGQRIGPDDVAVERAAIPDEAAAAAFDHVDAVEGSVALVAIDRGAVVERAALAPSGRDPTGPQLSFAVDRTHALDGDLEPGDRLDLFATYGSGDGAKTVRVARAVHLVAVDTADHGGLEGSGKVVVTVELSPSDDLLAVAHATDVASVSLVRPARSTTDAGSGDQTSGDQGSSR